MKVVVVDDEVGVLRLIESALAQTGHEIIAFSDAEQAVREMPEDCDLLLSDLHMPGVNGFQLAREAAQKLGPSPPRVLLMTGYKGSSDGEGLSSGSVIGIMHKPFSIARLSQAALQITPVMNQIKAIPPRKASTGGNGSYPMPNLPLAGQ